MTELNKLMQETPLHRIRTIEDAIRNVSLHLRPKRNKARLAVLTISEPVEQLFSSDNFRVSTTKLSEVGDLFKLQLKYQRTPTRFQSQKPEWLFWRYKNSDIYLLISHTTHASFYKDILYYIDRYYPKVSRVYYNTYRIHTFLNDISNSSDDTIIRVLKTVVKKGINSVGSRKSIASRIDWTDISLKEAFSKLFEQNLWLKSIDFSIHSLFNNRTIETNGAISRDGMIVCKDGFSFFFNIFILRALEAAKKENELLRNRSRNESEKLEAKPLKIKLRKNIFKDKSVNNKFYSSMRSMKYCGLSAFHSNPYFHASLIDYKDGSTYRIWVLSEDTITIVPQMRATVASLERIINHIGESFLEGDVSEL